MSPEKQRIAIAEACGVAPQAIEWCCWSPDRKSTCMSAPTKRECQEWLDRLPEGSWAKCYIPAPLLRYPDYLNDLNAMHEAEKTLDAFKRMKMRGSLAAVITGLETPLEYKAALNKPPLGDIIHATAAQRAEAFLRTLGKWEDSPK